MNRTTVANVGAALLVLGPIWAAVLWYTFGQQYALGGLAVFTIGALGVAYGTAGDTEQDPEAGI